MMQYPTTQTQMNNNTNTKQWSQYQQNIFSAIKNRKKSIIINAGAGCAKTSTIVEAAKRLPSMEQEFAIFMCFNVDIKKEIADKLRDTGIEVINFHSLGLRVINENLGTKLYGNKINQFKYSNIINNILGIDYRDKKTDKTLLAFRDSCVSFTKIMLQQVATKIEQLEFPEIHILDLCDSNDILYGDSLYNANKYRGSQKIDHIALFETSFNAIKKGIEMTEKAEQISFEDMLFMPVFLQFKFQKYSTIFIDECQDLTGLQRQIALKSGTNKTMFIAVGDPRQAIYGFAGADSNSFNNVKAAIEAVEMPLSICYRCPDSHLVLARDIVPTIETWDQKEEGIVQTLKYDDALEAMQSKDMVLCRMTAPLIKCFFDLVKKGKRAYIKGKDQSKDLAKFAQSIMDSEKCSFTELLDNISTYVEKKTDLYESIYKNPENKIMLLTQRTEVIEYLTQIACEKGITDINEFEDFLQPLFSNEGDGIVLSTIHRAKGLETDNVFFLDKQLIPNRRAKTPEAKTQEYNLLYVGLTRAKKTLTFFESK